MLQFLIGTTTLNIAGLTQAVLGSKVYNSPPVFFVGLAVLLATGFYGLRLRREIVMFVAVVGGLGLFSAVTHGLTVYHLRQILAFLVSAIVWFYVYQTAAERDIFTPSRTRTILAVYATAMALMLTERTFFGSGKLVYAVSSIFSTNAEWLESYATESLVPRLSYFSSEPSTAACAIAATIMPFTCARVLAERSLPAYGMFGVAALVLFLAEGMTSTLLLAFSIAFIIAPRLATLAVPVILGAVAVVAAMFVPLLNDRNLLIDFLTNLFGGVYGRIDEGIASGSYISRLGNWFIGARTFIDAPLLGQGLGGTGANFIQLANQGLDVFFTAEQQGMVEGENTVYNAQMVLRIPAEIGIVGTLFILNRAWKAWKLAERARQGLPPMDYYAFLYITGAMLVTFVTNSEYALPTIVAFVALLAQTRRKLGELKPIAPAAETPAHSSLPSGSAIA